MPTTTILYAGLLGLLAFGLAVQCGRARGRTGVNVGDGGNDDVVIAMRSHANFVEFAPPVLILIALLELNGVPGGAIHAHGAAFVVGRLCHAFGFTAAHPTHVLRTVGAMTSTLVLVVSSVWAIVVGL